MNFLTKLFLLKVKRNNSKDLPDSPKSSHVTVVKEAQYYPSQSTIEIKTKIENLFEELEQEFDFDQKQSKKFRKLKRLVDQSINLNLEYEKRQKLISDDEDNDGSNSSY